MVVLKLEGSYVAGTWVAVLWSGQRSVWIRRDGCGYRFGKGRIDELVEGSSAWFKSQSMI